MIDESLTRRNFLIGAAAASVAFPAYHMLAAEPVDTIVDTHTHFYDPTRPEGVPWPGKNDKVLYRPVLPEEYQALTKRHHVTGTVVVEASPLLEDNQWILDLADRNPFVLGLVGHLTPGTEDFASHLRRFAKNQRFRGIRVGHSAVKSGLSEKAFLADVQRLADHDLELDINGGPDMLPDIARLAKAIPTLRIVINHVANVRIDGKTPPVEWVTGMEACAASENVFCKVSALVEGARRDDQTAPEELSYYVPVLDTVWKAFGADRLIYGSNWPVSARYAPYAQVQRIVTEYFQAKGRDAYEKFFWKNALAAYKWPISGAKSTK